MMNLLACLAILALPFCVSAPSGSLVGMEGKPVSAGLPVRVGGGDTRNTVTAFIGPESPAVVPFGARDYSAPRTIRLSFRNPLTLNAPEPVVVNPEPPVIPVTTLILRAAQTYGVDAALLSRIAWCESNYRTDAVNPKSGASGVMQFLPTTWRANSARYGWGGASVFDAEANVAVASAMIAHGNIMAWASSERCWS